VVFFADAGYVVADEDRGTAVLAEGDGALGVPAEGEAGGAEDAALFLETAAVGEHDAGIHVEAQHVVVADRI
jgi:hypothetical protein